MKEIPPTSTTITGMFYKQNGDLNISSTGTDSQLFHNLENGSTTEELCSKTTYSPISNFLLYLKKRDQVSSCISDYANRSTINATSVAKSTRSTLSLDKINTTHIFPKNSEFLALNLDKIDSNDSNTTKTEKRTAISSNKDLVETNDGIPFVLYFLRVNWSASFFKFFFNCDILKKVKV